MRRALALRPGTVACDLSRMRPHRALSALTPPLLPLSQGETVSRQHTGGKNDELVTRRRAYEFDDVLHRAGFLVKPGRLTRVRQSLTAESRFAVAERIARPKSTDEQKSCQCEHDGRFCHGLALRLGTLSESEVSGERLRSSQQLPQKVCSG